ncbi:MAG TPA: ATP-binding protein [Polyangia bacterium]|jgi:serine/threonine-protein kinase RsbW
MTPGSGRLVVSVPARIEYRDAVGALLVEVCRGQLPGDQGAVLGHHLVSAFNEAFNNAVLHAYAGRPEGTVDVELCIEPPRIELRVADHGQSFDPRTVKEPDLDKFPEGGLGLYIMRSFMNEIDYRAGEPNVLTMVKYLDGGASL